MEGLFPPFPVQASLVEDTVHATTSQLTSENATTGETSPSPALSLTLPAIYLDENGVHVLIDKTNPSVLKGYFDSEVSVCRLNNIYDYLWLADTKGHLDHSLTEQVMRGRSLILTPRADMHMVVHGQKLYIKPVPDFLLCHTIWTSHLCQDALAYGSAFGLLWSYTRLIRNKSDFRIAKINGILSEEITWQQWSPFCAELEYTWRMTEMPMHVRYTYSELRLARLNWIYRLSQGNIIRGYYRQESRGWLVGTLVYITIVLTAMQVGLGTDRLSNNESFQRASYGFTIFSIIAPVLILATYVGTVIMVAVWNVFLMAVRTRKVLDPVELGAEGLIRGPQRSKSR